MDPRSSPGKDESQPQLCPPALYVNFLRISPAESEFFLHFGQLPQGETRAAHLAASLVTTPQHAKAMLRVLQEAVERHEQRFGEVRPATSCSVPGEPDRASAAGAVPAAARPLRAHR
jgi:hypothetical protein